MAHALVEQLRFTRSEWLRGLKKLTEEEATKHFGQMNCISWIVGHLGWHEQRYWLNRSQNIVLFPDLDSDFAYGKPMSTPPLGEMLEKWKAVTKATEKFLDGVTSEILQSPFSHGKVPGQTYGSAMQRVIYHYWYHIGEIQAIRQMLGHKNLPVYVGNIDQGAPYRP